MPTVGRRLRERLAAFRAAPAHDQVYRAELLRWLSGAVLLPLVISLFLGPVGAGVLLYVFFWGLGVVAPAVLLGRVLYPWVLGEQSLLAGLRRLLTLAIFQCSTDIDLRRSPPLLTTALILLNIYCFLSVAQPWSWALQSDDATVVALFSSMFLHADLDHVLGNMLFFWAFASALEGRLGPLRLLVLYLVCGLCAGFAQVLMTSGQLPPVRMIGASGAIAGVMGLYVVRCLRSQVVLAIPLLPLAGPLAPSIRMRVPAVLLISLFCTWDLASAVGSDGIAHWAHLGGYYAGMGIAFAAGMLREGLREHFVALGSRPRAEHELHSRSEVLDQAVQLEGDDVQALLARAQHRTSLRPCPEAKADYERAIALLLERDRAAAARVFAEFFQAYREPLAPELQLALTPALVRGGGRDIAARALELARDRPGVPPRLHARVIFQHAQLLTELGCFDAARLEYERLVRDHPDDPAAAAARARLGA